MMIVFTSSVFSGFAYPLRERKENWCICLYDGSGLKIALENPALPYYKLFQLCSGLICIFTFCQVKIEGSVGLLILLGFCTSWQHFAGFVFRFMPPPRYSLPNASLPAPNNDIRLYLA